MKELLVWVILASVAAVSYCRIAGHEFTVRPFAGVAFTISSIYLIIYTVIIVGWLIETA